MEEQITTVGTILLGAFYAIGYLLNRQAKKKGEPQTDNASLDSDQTVFLSTLSSTASQSTTLNIKLWQKVTELEELLEDNQQQIKVLKRSNQDKDQRISDLEEQIHQIRLKNTELITQVKQLESQ